MNIVLFISDDGKDGILSNNLRKIWDEGAKVHIKTIGSNAESINKLISSIYPNRSECNVATSMAPSALEKLDNLFEFINGFNKDVDYVGLSAAVYSKSPSAHKWLQDNGYKIFVYVPVIQPDVLTEPWFSELSHNIPTVDMQFNRIPEI